MPLLKIQNLSRSFDDKKAINNISFALRKGEILAILGESGSGKTTLLHLIGALQEPDEGELLLEGNRITPPSRKLIAGHPDIKLVRQDYGLFPNISIRENIAYELRYYEENYRNKRVDKLLKLSGLDKVQTHLPREVSGGEQQRAVIAKAIAEQPKLLLLDEPFSHLDAVNKRRLKTEILRLIKAEEVSCIFVTHDVSDAYGMADRLAIMRKGKILQLDNPQTVYQHPANRYVAEITGEVNIVNEDWVAKAGIKHQFVRPEQIRLALLSPLKATVLSVKFLGSYYEISLKCLEQELKMFSFEALVVGAEIGIEIKN
ncbi:ABC transporter ATP-binding protein [Emticicia sp. 21SJ11W-3]|uniref:ABC transporter ATP-binding protein n=1 Tax=Emticicia sp. 21SJ11W-3 TaxID=2916755 RepID=UPI0020A1B15A|nr:ABC transporter ATP-binding protein [Emticicia sp. 21SJ11W-3]UTA68819.1 ABC transporter ATP-binding protein [Emticicia sp. 21SJ11W-3]